MTKSTIELPKMIADCPAPILANPLLCAVHSGENLEFMATQPSNSIDLIYCDVLYGTGRNFGDYQDLKPVRSEIENHYKPRIKEMYRLLKDTGSIYLQMDTKINHWVRCIMDDVFGYYNLRNEIIWFYPGREKKSKINFQNKHDVILFYSKSAATKINHITKKWDKKERVKALRRKIHKDENGKEWFWETRGQANGVEKYKKYLNEYLDKGGALNDVWDDIQFLRGNHPERVGYATQKPKELIERIIKASSNEGDTVADFYLGSGTTAVVCKELNRNFIGCDINEKAIKIAISRLNN